MKVGPNQRQNPEIGQRSPNDSGHVLRRSDTCFLLGEREHIDGDAERTNLFGRLLPPTGSWPFILRLLTQNRPPP